jgi:plasmid stabilization system protein ParE
MQAETVWLDQALDDIKAILDYISADSPKAAARYVRELQESCERLRDFPLSGRAYANGYRCLVFRNHLALHRFDEASGVVSIVRIIDARRDIDRLLKGSS